MMPQKHIIFGLGLSIVLFVTGMPPILILLIVATSILVDIDHLFYYIFKFRKCNIYEVYIYFMDKICFKNNKSFPVLIFHNFETLMLLIILSLICPLFIYIAIGLFIHLILDWLVMSRTKYPYTIKMSLILTLLSNRKRC